MRRIIVCDTGPLLHLGEANIINLLHLAGEIIIHLSWQKNSNGMHLISSCPTGLPSKNEEPYHRKTLEWRKQIDEGEAAAIALTMQMQAEWLLTDDAIARQFGESLGLEIHGSIGLLLWAVAVGHVKSENEALISVDALAGSSL